MRITRKLWAVIAMLAVIVAGLFLVFGQGKNSAEDPVQIMNAKVVNELELRGFDHPTITSSGMHAVDGANSNEKVYRANVIVSYGDCRHAIEVTGEDLQMTLTVPSGSGNPPVVIDDPNAVKLTEQQYNTFSPCNYQHPQTRKSPEPETQE